MSVTPSFDNAIRFAQDLIRIPGLSGREGDVARRVVEEMEALGYRDVRTDRAGNAIGVIPGTGGGPTILLNCHMDVVAAGDPGEWEVAPFDGVMADGVLHGRGAMDIKGPLALQTHAAALLAGQASGDVVVAHTVYEERGGLGMKVLLEDGEVAPDGVVIGESTHGDICVGHRGRAEVEVVLEGMAGHASAPERARNALLLLPPVLEALDAISRDQPSDPVLGAASMAPTMVDVLPESRNVIPDRVVVTLDWRILPGTTREALVDRVRIALEAALEGRVPEGMGWSVRMGSEHQECYTGLAEEKALLTPGFLVEPEHPVIRAAAEAVGRRHGTGPATVRPWTFATDGGWSCGVHGIPTLGFAPGEERFAHTNREQLDLDEARWAFERYPALIQAMQGALAGVTE
ncbi:MAG TPA: M20/M25/M40 family metallo-hydrolase [Longimicrobiales bacterium]|nr:M20/M25/M40 family metallo-hydrolase [Longimicrobiales bacterium]